MVTKICACCGKPFEPRPQVPNQAYCSTPDCQRARRRNWQRHKMQNDLDYRDNQSRSQRAWLDRNPDYWRNYRQASRQGIDPDLRTENLHLKLPKTLAKMDAWPLTESSSGIYRIQLISRDGYEVGGTWMVKIAPICQNCICKMDACKDRT